MSGEQPRAVTAAGDVVPWAIDETEATALLADILEPGATWAVVGARPFAVPAAHAAAHVDDTGSASVVLVADRPAAIERVARDVAGQSARAGADDGALVATLDWPLAGLPTTATETGGHQLYWYEHLAHVLSFDDTRRLVVVHPNFSGMLSASLHALDDVAELVVEADQHLDRMLRPVVAPGPLAAGQVRPVDLVIDPAAIPGGGARGVLLAYDAARADRLPARLEFHVYRSGATECAVAGEHDGPLSPVAFASAIERARRPLIGPRSVARAIDRAWREDAGADSTAPWWSTGGHHA